jgi:hypothetical protein
VEITPTSTIDAGGGCHHIIQVFQTSILGTCRFSSFLGDLKDPDRPKTPSPAFRMVISMVGIERIPTEARWKLSSRGWTSIPVAYAKAVRNLVGPEYQEGLDAIAEAVWSEAGKEQATIARAFRFPANNALQVSEALFALSKIYLGAELKGTIQEESSDVAVCTTVSCPMFKRAIELDVDPVMNCPACRGFKSGVVESLNPGYTVRSIKSMCKGDDVCILRIGPR